MDVNLALILFLLLEVKHLFADFFLQTPLMLSNRGQYVHSGRASHCIVHAAGSGVALALVGAPIGLLLPVVIAEWFVHYHIDYAKGAWSNHVGHGPTDASYWHAFGVDQFLHQLTYVVMVWVVV